MSFDSLEFLVFLPLVVLAHRLSPARWRWAVLLAASYVFYAWWDLPLALLILAVTAVTYLAGRMLERAQSLGARRFWLAAALGVCLGLLGYFKYFNFLGRSAAALVGALGGASHWEWEPWDIVLPVGVSFYTFQALSYVVDVFRGTLAAEGHFGHYALYISFFPQLVAGPIERAGALLPQLKAAATPSREDLAAGCRLLVSGFFRKVVLADGCAPFVEAAYSDPNPCGATVFLGTMLFAAQIYCDFAGYSEIAAGAARLLGIRLMQNFEQPYGAQGIRDFWRRWHISLTNWFTDYVYIPLGGSKKGLFRQICATFAVFFCSGLWHGADWSFVAWGLLHACYMTVELLGQKALAAFRRRRGPGDQKGPKRYVFGAIKRGITLAAVGFAWIFFRADDLGHAQRLVKALFSSWKWGEITGRFGTILVQYGTVWGCVFALGCAFLAALTLRRLAGTGVGRKQEEIRDMTWVFAVMAIALAWLLRLSRGGASAFIYFQF